MNPQRRQLLTGFGAATLAAAASRAGAGSGIVLTATDVHPANYPTVEAVRWLGERLTRETEGRLRLRQYPAGQLGRENDAIDLARFGAIDLVRVYSGALNNAVPLTLPLGLPGVFDSVEHLRRVLDGEVGAEVLAGVEARGLVGLAFYDCGVRCFYNTHGPIVTPADLRGLKLRVPPSDVAMRLLRALGANPTPLAYGEVFQALETGLVDAAENNLRSFHASRHFERARFWSDSRHSYAPDLLLMSKRSFDALAPDDQQRLRTAARESVSVMRRLWDEGEASARAALEAGGVAFNPVDAEAFGAAFAPTLAELRRDPRIDRSIAQIRDLA